MMSRRSVLIAAAATGAACSGAAHFGKQRRTLIAAPSNLGLRPEGATEPGTWRAPARLLDAGLQKIVGADDVIALNRPQYRVGAQRGTRIRNGRTIRDFSLRLGGLVRERLARRDFPIVVGGDCSILLGALHGARLAGCRGLVHVDGHSDFFHPGNYDTAARLGSAAGMDLALATGRGEALLTQWPEVDGPLVADEDAIQIGEREALDPTSDSFYGDVARTPITRFIVQDVLRSGVSETARAAISHFQSRGIDRAWLHLDLDVLDETAMPAVDSPGSPGLSFDQFSELTGTLFASRRIAGATVAIYDPERDRDARYADPIVHALGNAFEQLL